MATEWAESGRYLSCRSGYSATKGSHYSIYYNPCCLNNFFYPITKFFSLLCFSFLFLLYFFVLKFVFQFLPYTFIDFIINKIKDLTKSFFSYCKLRWADKWTHVDENEFNVAPHVVPSSLQSKGKFYLFFVHQVLTKPKLNINTLTRSRS